MHARHTYASDRVQAGSASDKRQAPPELLDEIETLTRRQLQHLARNISRPRAHTLNETLRNRVGYRGYHGYREESFDRKDPRRMKSRILDMVSDVKKQLTAAGKVDWARQLRVASLKDGMCSVRKFGEHLHKNHQDSAPEFDALFAKLRHNTNWSCHAELGDRPFIVTPDNQKEAVRCLQQMLRLVLLSRRVD